MDKGKKLCRKKDIHFKIAAAVKKVQKQYIISTKEGSESRGSPVDTETLCGLVEAIFLHELKNGKGVLWREIKQPNPMIPPQPSFWVFIEPMISDEIKMQLLALRNSDLEVRKCRSWVRLMLSKNRMISFLEDILRHPGLLASHYGGGALLRDPEQSEILVHLLRGLVVLQLDYDYTNSSLDMWDPSILTLAGVWEGPGNEVPPSTQNIPVTSPGHPSPSTQRVSPPASNFDYEGVSIIGIALDKYSKKRRSSSNFSDSQLISKEIAGRLNPTPTRERRHYSGSVSSVESGISTTMGPGGMEPDLHGTSVESGITTTMSSGGMDGGSYGAMLRSYAKRAGGSSAPQKAGELPLQVAGSARTAGGSSGTHDARETEGGLEDRREEDEGEKKREIERYNIALSLDYEIIAADGSLVDSMQYQPPRSVMVDHLVKLVNEKGLDSQNYKCFNCSRDIGLIFGLAKLCKFNGQHYCFECHRDDERVIPARVLFSWDFRPHKVSQLSCEFLDSIYLSPILDVEQINKALYLYIPALEEALKLRQQCRYLKDYLITCNKPDAIEQFRKRLKSSHIYEDVHKYSLRDLIDVNGGAFNERLKKLVRVGIKHVKHCELCSQKGFICEVCADPKVIYPFNVDETSQCASCKSVYHNICRPVKRACPKCIRLRKRADSISTNSTG